MSVSSFCSPYTDVTGGGYEVLYGTLEIRKNRPIRTLQEGAGWQVTAHNSGLTEGEVRAWIVCAAEFLSSIHPSIHPSIHTHYFTIFFFLFFFCFNSKIPCILLFTLLLIILMMQLSLLFHWYHRYWLLSLLWLLLLLHSVHHRRRSLTSSISHRRWR